jgi:2-dehydropantoate 2-reductase
LLINGSRLDIPVTSGGIVAASGEEPGLVIVAVKGQHLAQAIDDMRPYVGPDTLILSLLNGISSEDELSAAFGAEHVLYAMIIGIDALREGSAITYTRPGTINFGEALNKPGEPGERVVRVSRFLDRAGLRHEVPENMVRTMWYKFMINVGINQASAVLRAPYGAFQKIPETQRVMESAMLEVIALSKALGTGLSEEDMQSWYKTLGTLSPDGKTSMLQDVEAGRKTEVELFSGTVIRLGGETGVLVPVNRMLYDMIRAIEQS